MSLPDPLSSDAIALLQQAIGHVTVDGTMNQQTIDSVSSLDAQRFRESFFGLLTRRFGQDDGTYGPFIESVLGTVPVNS